MSWIWTSVGSQSNDEEHLHESLWIEWSWALARKTRWEEEVMLIREEMRRVLRYLEWEQKRWEEKKTARTGQVEAGIQQGLAVYAVKQFFKTQWTVSLGNTTQSLLTTVKDESAAELDQSFGEGACYVGGVIWAARSRSTARARPPTGGCLQALPQA
ncbi:hypothetical protein C8R43DRAFT_955258 [Mycena crocata]|nr:hypothetical protein C8R43DRAFT_955258 [Mycena crocata]